MKRSTKLVALMNPILVILVMVLTLFGCSSESQIARLDAANNWSTSVCFGAHKALVTLTPAKPGTNTIKIELKDEQGDKISDAKITALATSPTGEVLNTIVPEGSSAIYQAKIDLIEGAWQFDFTVRPPNELKYQFSVRANLKSTRP